MSSFPLWQVDPAQSRRITGTRIVLGILAGLFLLPAMFVIVATSINLLASSGYAVPDFVRYAFYLASQALPYAMIAVIASTPFCFAARRTGLIGLGPLLVLALAICILLASVLWVARILSFDLVALFWLAVISQAYGLTLWLVLRMVCVPGFRPRK